jgi:hypothetical protein
MAGRIIGLLHEAEGSPWKVGPSGPGLRLTRAVRRLEEGSLRACTRTPLSSRQRLPCLALLNMSMPSACPRIN